MVALRLIRLIETHSEQIAESLVTKIQSSPRTRDLQKIPKPELLTRMLELLQHLSEWLLTKTDGDIETRYRQIGSRRAAQGVSLSDSCWAVTITKEFLWDFLQKQGFLHNPIELYGEMELLSLLNQFFDRAVCHVVEGYEIFTSSEATKTRTKKEVTFNAAAAFVP
jgi:hypothetical protein